MVQGHLWEVCDGEQTLRGMWHAFYISTSQVTGGSIGFWAVESARYEL